jgi:hypothetical protein
VLVAFLSLISFVASPNPQSVAPPPVSSSYYYPPKCIPPSLFTQDEPDFHPSQPSDGAQVNRPTEFCIITPSPELKSAHLPVYPSAPTEEAPHFSQHATPCTHPEEVKALSHLSSSYLPFSSLGLIDVDTPNQKPSSQTAVSDAALKNETGIPTASCVMTESRPPPAQACGYDQQNDTRRIPVMRSMRPPTVESDDEDEDLDDRDPDDDVTHDSSSTFWCHSMIQAALRRRVPLLAALSDHLLAISKDPRIMRSDDAGLVALTNELLPDLLKLMQNINTLAVKVSKKDLPEVI